MVDEEAATLSENRSHCNFAQTQGSFVPSYCLLSTAALILVLGDLSIHMETNHPLCHHIGHFDIKHLTVKPFFCSSLPHTN